MCQAMWPAPNLQSPERFQNYEQDVRKRSLIGQTRFPGRSVSMREHTLTCGNEAQAGRLKTPTSHDRLLPCIVGRLRRVPSPEPGGR